MRIRVWVLSTCVPHEAAPCRPAVHGTEAAAVEAFDRAMREEWVTNAPTDDDGDHLPYPAGRPDEAVRLIAESDPDGEWGRWELTAHDVEVPDEPGIREVKT
jgi:hypothetical protein